jgi:hypothetical protein
MIVVVCWCFSLISIFVISFILFRSFFTVHAFMLLSFKYLVCLPRHYLHRDQALVSTTLPPTRLA